MPVPIPSQKQNKRKLESQEKHSSANAMKTNGLDEQLQKKEERVISHEK